MAKTVTPDEVAKVHQGRLFTRSSGELIITKDRGHVEVAEFKELPNYEGNFENMIRIYCRFLDTQRDSNCAFSVQFRVQGPIDDHRKCKTRNMIATASLTIADVEEILKYMREEQHRYDKAETTA